MLRPLFNPFYKNLDIAYPLLYRYIGMGLSEEAAQYFFDHYSKRHKYDDILDFAEDLDFFYKEFKKQNTWLKKLFGRANPYCYFTIWAEIERRHTKKIFDAIRETAEEHDDEYYRKVFLSSMIASKKAMDNLQRLKEEGLRAFDT